jgi:MFS family permease
MRAVHSLVGLIVMSALYGFISGGMVSLPPAVIANLTTKKDEFGVRIGVGYTIAAFGALIGNPIAGALQLGNGTRRDRVQEKYQGTWFFAGAVMMVCTALLIFVQLTTRGKLGRK